MMTAQYPCDFTDISLTQCCNLAIAVQVQYNYLKSPANNHCAMFLSQMTIQNLVISARSVSVCGLLAEPVRGMCSVSTKP